MASLFLAGTLCVALTALPAVADDEDGFHPPPSSTPVPTGATEAPAPPPPPSTSTPTPQHAPSPVTPTEGPSPGTPVEDGSATGGAELELNVGPSFLFDSSRSDNSLGLGLAGVGGIRLSDSFSLRLRAGAGFAYFERIAAAFNAGVTVGAWTGGAYASVTDWLVTGDPAFLFFKFFGAMIAYTFLTLGFAVAGLLILFSPIFSLTTLETGITGAFHLVQGATEVFVEGGLGGLLYLNRSGGPKVGWGPLIGLGVRSGPIGGGLHLLFSPAPINSSRDTVLAGGVSFRFGF